MGCSDPPCSEHSIGVPSLYTDVRSMLMGLLASIRPKGGVSMFGGDSLSEPGKKTGGGMFGSDNEGDNGNPPAPKKRGLFDDSDEDEDMFITLIKSRNAKNHSSGTTNGRTPLLQPDNVERMPVLNRPRGNYQNYSSTSVTRQPTIQTVGQKCMTTTKKIFTGIILVVGCIILVVLLLLGGTD